jgi:hypothetical protein
MFIQSKTHDSLNWIDSECIEDSVQYSMLPFLVQILWNRKKKNSNKHKDFNDKILRRWKISTITKIFAGHINS